MSILLDRQYIGYITNRLERFKPVSSTTWVCKCCFCDGSTSNPNKLTAYLITRDTGVFYYCHTCQLNYPLWKFLKETDTHLYNEYQKENYIENGYNRKSSGQPKTVRKAHLDVKLCDASSVTENVLNTPYIDYECILKDTPFIPLSKLSNKHKAKEYLRSRMISETQWDRLAYIPCMGDIAKYHPDYVNMKKSKEERLIIPLINKDMKLIGATCRALDDNAMRYIEVSFTKDEPMIFGMERINNEETKYVTEGWADSIFMGNSIAIGGLALAKVGSLGFDKQSTILIPDNQSRHHSVINAVDKMINAGYRVCLLPHSYKSKDINDMLKNGEMAIDNIKNIVESNTHHGLEGKLYFSKWRKL